MSSLLEVRDVSRRFGATQALRRVSLKVAVGQVHCLLGENGAGKSTLGKIIAGLIDADEGDIQFAGQSLRGISLRQARDLGIALAYQELSLADDLSVSDNLNLGREPFQKVWSPLNKRQEKQAAQTLLQSLRIDVSAEQSVGTLTAGQRQLVEVAKALAGSPRLVVLDEPTATLNAVEKQVLFDVLRQLKQQGVSFILVTHHVEDVLEVGDHVTLLKNSEVVDSFAVTPGLQQEDILEKLCGRRSIARAPAVHLPESTQQETLLRIAGLSDRHGRDTKVSIARQQIVAFYGVVGCGNEDIAHALVGLANTPNIRLELEGADFRPVAPYQAARQGIAYLAPKRVHGILPERSVKENLNLSTLHNAARGGWISQRREDDITMAKIDEFGVKCESAQSAITALSGGNQQKVLLGRALANAKRLIVLEEPTAGIDIGAKLAIHDLIRERVAGTGLSVVLISSDLGEVLSVADVVYTMFHGRTVKRYERPTPEDQADIVFDILGETQSAAYEEGAR